MQNNSKTFESLSLTAGLVLLAVLSLASAIYAGFIQTDTLVHLSVPILTSALGFILSLVLLFVFNNRYLSTFQIFLFSAVIGGCLGYSLPFFLNKVPVNNPIVTERFEVIDSGKKGWSKYGQCLTPFVSIEYHDIRKDLLFPCDKEKEVLNATQVELTYAKGLLGYPIISNWSLIY